MAGLPHNQGKDCPPSATQHGGTFPAQPLVLGQLMGALQASFEAASHVMTMDTMQQGTDWSIWVATVQATMQPAMHSTHHAGHHKTPQIQPQPQMEDVCLAMLARMTDTCLTMLDPAQEALNNLQVQRNPSSQGRPATKYWTGAWLRPPQWGRDSTSCQLYTPEAPGPRWRLWQEMTWAASSPRSQESN